RPTPGNDQHQLTQWGSFFTRRNRLTFQASPTDPQTKRILERLEEEFPDGEEGYRKWFVRALGILGDSAAARKAIKAANEAGIKLAGNGYGYPRAFTVNPQSETIVRIKRLAALKSTGNEDSGATPSPRVFDPFSGGGSIPFEAARYGFDTVANELNPVAAAILQGTLVLPAQLGPEFGKTIATWGEEWSNRLRNRLAEYFPHNGTENVVAYIWAHAVPCPTTGRLTPLMPDFWLDRGSSQRNTAMALEVDKESGRFHVNIVHGVEAKEWGQKSTYKGGTGTSIWTGEPFSGAYIRTVAQEGRMGQILLAVVHTNSGGRGRAFRPATEADIAAVESAESELARKFPGWEISDLAPIDDIDSISNYDRGHRMYGISRWSEFFTPRQLLVGVTALEELHTVTAEARERIGDEKSRALALYLAFALDKMVDYNSRQSSWDASRTKIRSTFDKHNFNFKWSFAEFDGAYALAPWAVNNAVVNHAKISALVSEEQSLVSEERRAAAQVIRGSASNVPLPDNSVDVIVTDPPYYDNVMYAEISDFFYVWLKRSLRHAWPEYADLQKTDKDSEAVANPALFKGVAETTARGRRKGEGGKRASELADARYEELLKQSFKEAHRVLKHSGMMTVMFTHKRIDAWDTLGAALLDAGFSIDASWPVHTESENSTHQAKKNAAQSTIFLACKKRAGSESAYWSDIRRDVERVAEDAATRFASEGMTGVDLTIATYGPVLSVLSERWPVFTGELDDDGSPEVLRPDAALDLAREKVASLKKRELLGGREIDFDRVTDWYLLAWNDFAAAEFPYDEARKLSIATHLDLDDLAKRHKMVKQSSGSVTLLTPAQRATAGGLDIDAAEFDTWIDRLHSLMLLYDSEGLAAAKAWLNRARLADDPTFTAVFRAALYAIPRVKDKGEFARPEARILDSLRAALFDHVEAPADELGTVSEAERQGALFDV
ncbi:DUF1156 domain-containing protein, partial [Streptomyces pilosus]|uniref:DUF1156 domain-containing protein n=1 Tax=Streptomyces pilosus TaxID=28893 RepID=UPI0036A43573